jgi:hypothetical protein
LERDDILIFLGTRSGAADLDAVGRAGTGDTGEEKHGRERAVRRAEHRSETAGRTWSGAERPAGRHHGVCNGQIVDKQGMDDFHE